MPGLFCCDQYCCSQDLVHSLCCILPGLDSGEVLKLQGQQPKVSGASAAGLQQCTSSQLTVAKQCICSSVQMQLQQISLEVWRSVTMFKALKASPGLLEFVSLTVTQERQTVAVVVHGGAAGTDCCFLPGGGLQQSTCDISRFSPQIQWIFPGEALNPFFSAQDERFSEFCST